MYREKIRQQANTALAKYGTDVSTEQKVNLQQQAMQTVLLLTELNKKTEHVLKHHLLLYDHLLVIKKASCSHQVYTDKQIKDLCTSFFMV